MPEPVAVKLSCLETLLRPAEVRHIRRMADQRVSDDSGATVLLIDPGHAFYKQQADIFEGCKGETPTEAATAAAEATKAKPIAPRPGFPAFNGYDGSKRWRELHMELSPSPETVAWVLSRTCLACQPHARALVTKMPPDFTSLDGYRRWSVRYHAAVSASIGNPPLTYEQAALRWGW